MVNKVTELPVRPKKRQRGELQLAETHRGCEHKHLVVDERAAEVECADCGVKLNPMWALARLARDDSDFRREWDRMRAAVRLLKDKTKTKCRHCGQMTPVKMDASYYQILTVAEQIKREDEQA